MRAWLRGFSLNADDRKALTKAGRASAWVFVSLFLTSFLGWMGDLIDWLTEDSYEFPDPAALPTALAAAILSAFVFAGSAIVQIASAHISGGEPEEEECKKEA